MSSLIENKDLQNYISKDVANLSVPFRHCNSINNNSILLQSIKDKYITNKMVIINSDLFFKSLKS